MEKLKLRYIILTALLAITAVVVNFLNYDIFYKAGAAVDTIKKLPMRIGKWQGHDVPLDNRIYEILETKAIINRRYVGEGREVFLSLVYYPETKVDFHAPEGCLAGRGIEISKTTRSISLKYQGNQVKLALNQLVRRDKGSEELYFYFYKAGHFMGADYIKLRLHLALNKISSNRKSGALIRVSTPVFAEDYESASKLLTNFIEDMYPYLVKYL